MDCGNCSHENETSAKFCSECGAPLALRCVSCDAVQPAGSKFCNQCGTPVGKATASTEAATTPESTAVRKNVTALFGDLVGSTSFGEQVDPEATRAVMAEYFELLRSTIEDHAGTVAKFMGDGVMAVFGIPEIAEDDALRAVAAATELQQRFRSFAENVRDRHGVELGLRVGVNTGELVIGDDDADMVGDVLNTAARLEAACQPGRVLVGEDTWRLTRSSITYEVLGEIRVKGKAEPIATFQVVTGTDQATDEVTPFVGRQDELAELQAVFSEARDRGAARLATVIGAPGVGKTRLAAELRAAHDVRSFDLRFERRGSTTFTPIADLLRELTGTGSADDVARLVAGHNEAGRLTDVLAALLGHGETRSTEESFWAVRRLLEMLAIDGPLIMVVDDIQWAEPLFWDLLDHLVEWTDAPVFLLALARPELRELQPELAQIGKRVSAAIALEGLDAATTRELAAQLLDTDELPADLIERIPDSTDGNPLFVREMVQMLVDDGVLARTGDRWRLTIDVEAIEVPPTILSLLASRVERLPDDERQVVELASVIGTEFDRGSLTALAGGEIGSRLGALIDRLRRKDLIEPSGAWAGDHPVYRFHHVLIRDAAYRRLLKARRADLHERVGRHLETAEATNELDVVIAHHYEQVHAYRSDLGTLDDVTTALADQAARRLQSAALLALAREDLSASGGYALRALALTPDGETRDDLLTLGCEALLSSGDVTRGSPVVDELTQRSTDPRLEAWADCFRAQLWSLTDSERLIEASQLANGAADRLTSLDDDAGVAKARLVRALILARLGRVGDCEAELDLALGAARAAGDRRRTVAVLGAAPLAALWGPSPVARAGGRCLDVLRLLRITTSSPAVEATSIRCQGMLEALRGRFDSAREKFETSRTTARDLGLRHGLYETELFEGFAELLAGDPVAAEPHLVLARDGLGALGIGADAGQASALLARALLRQGRIDEADVLASAALEAAGENLQTAVASRSVLGEIRVEQGRPDEARQLIAAALDIVERTDITIDHAVAQRSAARVADRLGDADDAESHRAAAERLLADKGVTGLTETRSERTVADTSEYGPTADDGEPRRAAMVPPNSAWEVNEGLWSTWIAGDRSGYLQLLASDFRARIHELGPKLAFSGDRYATADVLFESLADDRAHAIPNRLIAVRGDDLALIAMTFRDGESSTTMYTLSQVRDGRAVRADTFAEDQLGDALDELDRRSVTLGAPADAVELLIELRRSTADGDYTGLRGLLADDFEMVSHEGLTLIDRRSADDFVESTRPLYGEGGLATPILTDVPAITDGLALTRHHLDAADGSGWRLWYLWVWESGRFTRAEIYELDDFEIALARFEELAADDATEPDSTNDGARRRFDELAGVPAAGSLWEAMRASSGPQPFDEVVELLAETLSPRFRFNGRRTSAPHFSDEGPEFYLDTLAAWGAMGATTIRHVPVALRDDRLFVTRANIQYADGSEMVFLNVLLLDDENRIQSITTFDTDQLQEALDELDRQWVELGGPARLIGFTQQMRHANWSGDADLLPRCLLPEWAFHDRRRLGVGKMTRQQYLSSSVAKGGGVTVVVPEYIAYTEVTALTRDRFVTPDGSEWDMLSVGTFGPDGCRSTDVFDTDDLDAARARYQELTRTAKAAPQTPTNAATRMIDEYTAALNDGDLDRFRAAFHPEARQELRQRLQVEDVIDIDGIALLGRSIIAGNGVLSFEPVAIFGNHLAVCTQVLRFGPDEVRECSVVEIANGLVTRIVRFDDDQQVEALDTFTRRAAELGRPAALANLEIAIRGAHWRHDVEAFKQALDPSWAFHDHRRLGLGRMTREQYLASSFPVGPGEVLHWSVEVLAQTDSVALTHDRWLTADGSGWDNLHVFGFGSGTAQSSDTFDLSDLDAARARYDELVDASCPVEPGALANTATDVAKQFELALKARDLDLLRGMLDPDYKRTMREKFRTQDTWGIDGEIDFLRGLADVKAVIELEPIAIRGDDLSAFSAVIGSEHTNLDAHAITVVRDGLILELITFDDDQLEETLDELDRQWVELGGPSLVANRWTRWRQASYTRDSAAIAELLAENFVDVDHRPLGKGTRNRQDYLDALGPLAGAGAWVIPTEIVAVADNAALARVRMKTDSELGEWDLWAVTVFSNDLMLLNETFPIDRFEDAQARFDELVSSAAPAPS